MAAQIGLVGDFSENVTAHRAIPLALSRARARSKQTQEALAWTWIHTSSIDPRNAPSFLERFDALWCVPASPYANIEGALAAITFARETQRPFLGTCGGFQHALIEWAGSKWGVKDPSHAETDPGARDPIIAQLSCSLVEQSGPLRFEEGSRLAAIYRQPRASETYHCRFGLSAKWADRLKSEAGPLRACAYDDNGEVRAIELDDHPFFIATLFQPERSALKDEDHCLIEAFAGAALAHHGNV